MTHKNKLLSQGLNAYAYDKYGITVKRGRARFIDRKESGKDDTYFVFLELFGDSERFIGQTVMEIGVKTDRAHAVPQYLGFYGVRHAEEEGSWGPKGISPEKAESLGQVVISDRALCRELADDLLSMADDPEVWQRIVSGFCMPHMGMKEQWEVHRAWLADKNNIF